MIGIQSRRHEHRKIREQAYTHVETHVYVRLGAKLTKKNLRRCALAKIGACTLAHVLSDAIVTQTKITAHDAKFTQVPTFEILFA